MPTFSVIPEEVQHIFYLDLPQESLLTWVESWAVGEVTKLWVWVEKAVQV